MWDKQRTCNKMIDFLKPTVSEIILNVNPFNTPI